jgi:hypothetical protein
MIDLLLYYVQLLLWILGTPALLGLSVRLCAVTFGRLSGASSGRVFDLTAVLGTPVHELGHAVMCPLFGHKVTKMCLWSPRHTDGRYGFVEHSYNKKNPWARIGSIFIGFGPLFSGLGVIALALWLCFPTLWDGYLAETRALTTDAGLDVGRITQAILSLLTALPRAFVADPLRSTLGLLLMLSVSLHVSLSAQDVKEALRALPLFLLLTAVVALLTWVARWSAPILAWFYLANVRLASLFALVLAFSLLWVALALLWRFLKLFVSWF